MFWKKSVEVDQLKEDIKLLQSACTGLKKDKAALKEELEELKLKKRLEQEEIKHLTKINEERLTIELDQKKVKLEQEYADKISSFKEEQRKALVESLTKFHEKMESKSEDEIKRIQQMYASIMGIMPKVNVMLEKKVKR